MSSSGIEIQEARAQELQINEDSMFVELADGRALIVPLAWFPRLWYGTAKERENFEIIGDGSNLHWPDLDEDVSITGLLAGRRSGESRESLKKWLAKHEPG
jgi:hypothetical protein